MTIKIGTLGKSGNVFLNWLDTDTGERDQGYFSLAALCELGNGDVRMVDIAVRVTLEKMERRER